MGEDILERAKRVEYPDSALRILPELIAEVERLRSELTTANVQLMAAGEMVCAKDARIDLLDSDQKRYHAAWMAAEEDKEEQAARIKELEAAVVDGRAQYLLFLDCNPDCTAWNFDELLEEDQNTLRRQARIILEMEEPWAYVQLREAREQVKLLEAAFLRSNAAMRYYQEGNRGPWPQLGEKFKEPYQEKAREALKRIKEGGKDE